MSREQYESHWKDYYQVLGVQSNASAKTIRRVWHQLSRIYHPDVAGDAEVNLARMQELNEAYEVLSDPEKRAAYDARHTSQRQLRWKIFDQAAVATGPEVEKRKRKGILALLYAATVKDPERATMTVHAFEDMLGCPREHLEAALWYLRGKGYVQRTDGGRYNLTVLGFDEAEEHCVTPTKVAGELPEPAKPA